MSMHVHADDAPTIVNQPSNQFVMEGRSAQFHVYAQGTAPFTYQWTRNGEVISGATSSLLTTSQVNPSMTGSVFQVTVSNSAGSVLSAVASLIVYSAPVLGVNSSVTAAVFPGQPGVMRVETTGGAFRIDFNGSNFFMTSSNVFFQVTDINGRNIFFTDLGSGGGSSQGRIQTSFEAGVYYVIVQSVGVQGTYTAFMSTVPAPVITTQPSDQAAIEGRRTTFSVAATGTIYGYQWYRDGATAPYPGYQPTYQIDGVSRSMHGARFHVRVTGQYGWIDSRQALLTVSEAPYLTLGSPRPSQIVAGDVDAFRVTVTERGIHQMVVTNSALSSYRISVRALDGVQLHGGNTNSVLYALLDPGTYLVRVENPSVQTGGTYTMNMSLVPPPTISTQPADQTVVEGHAASFSVISQSAAPISYQWSRDNVAIANAIQATYQIGVATRAMDDAGFHVRVSGLVDSRQAVLRVSEAPALAFGTPTTSQIVAGDVDVFRVNVATTGAYSFILSNIAISSYRISVLNLDGSVRQTGSTNSALQAFLDAGTYLIRISTTNLSGGTCSITMSSMATPVITVQPVPVAIIEAQNASFAVTATSAATMTYQWIRNGTDIPGQTARTISLTTNALAQDGTTYRVRVSNIAGSTLSDAATLSVGQAPPIAIGSPVQAVIPADNVAVFRATVADSGIYSFTMSNSSRPSSVLAILNLDGTFRASGSMAVSATLDPGIYLIRAINYNGAATGTITMSVLPPPVITVQPTAVTVTEGRAAVFSVTATSASPMTYRWSRNGTVISGQTGTTLTINPYMASNGSVYQATVTNLAGSTASAQAALQVMQAPTLTIGSTTQSRMVAGDVDVFRVQVTDRGPYSLVITGVGSYPYLTIRILDVAGNVLVTGPYHEGSLFTTLDPGAYLVRVEDAYRRNFTYAITMSSSAPPVITTEPASRSIIEGQPVSFAVFATSTSPMTYRWLRNGTVIPGQTSSTLTLNPAHVALDASAYVAEVTNLAGITLSQPATLQVAQAPALVIGTPVQSTVPAGTVDVRRVQVATTGGYTIAVSDYSRSYYEISLLNVDGTVRLTGSWNTPLHPTLDAGTYLIRVRDNGSAAATYTLAISSLALPVITTQPAAVTIIEGQWARFGVTATSAAPMTYQWRRNGTTLPGETISTYSIQTVDTSLNGSLYRVTVGNPAGNVNSDTAALQVQRAPSLAIDQTIESALTVPSDRRWFRVAIPTRSNYRVEVAAAGTNATRTLANPYLIIYSAARSWLYSDDDSGPGNDPLIASATLDPGDHIIEVIGAHPSYLGTFAISLYEVRPPTIVTQPIDASINVGQSATFSVVASGLPLTYQWSRNGTAIPAATAASYTVTNAPASLDGSLYQVLVVNPNGSLTSSPATLRVASQAPQVISGFGPLTPRTLGDAPFAITGVTGGGSGNPVTFTSGNTSLATISGNTVTVRAAGTVTITARQDGNADFAPATPVEQTLVINRMQQTVTFDPVADRVFGQPSFAVSARATSGLPVSFTVVSGPAAVIGNQVNISDAGTVTIAATQAGDANYLPAETVQRSLVVTASAPVIATQPQGGEIHIGDSTILRVVVGNPVLATYQWLRGSQPIPGATADSYTATVTEFGDVAYQVVVTNRFGAVTSDVATVRGTYMPVSIIAPPLSLSVQAGGSATLSVTARGTPPLTYQWSRDGVAIPGATASTYDTGVLTSADNGATFRVTVTNVVGPVTAPPAVLTVLAPPTIVVQPRDQNGFAGQSVTFEVVASGSAPLSYQWFRQGNPIAGARSERLVLSNLVPEDDGAVLTVHVSNALGSAVSTPAT
ncbi:MAG: immunoglobulin domain-containing protein, partial [Planctomycetes bacterium]|nr:immunoglobulin domain-containing protein [Planctomycetota bacterium]